MLLNDETGKRTVVNGCGTPSAFGAQWLAFDCSANPKLPFQLYNVQTRRWRRLPCDTACVKYSQNLSIVSVGARWLAAYYALPGPCGDGIHNECGPTGYLYYNIATGRQGFPDPGANEILSLDSPTLTRGVCSPVSVPSGSPTVPPPLAFDRGFAFVQSPNGVFVEGCGSPQQTYLTTNPNAYDIAPFWGSTKDFVGNRQAAGFCSGHLQGQGLAYDFSGVFLTSLTRFTATIPNASSCALLGPRHLYLVNANLQLIAATFPSSPPAAGQ